MLKNTKKKSLKINSILNVIKSLMTILFPLISFRYVSEILLVDNIGKYNYSASIVAYFSFFAAMGVHTYAVRGGAPLKEDRKELNAFASEIFSINVMSTILSYALLFLLLVVCRVTLEDYKIIIIILSIQILFKTISVDWIYSIFEDYMFVTIRSIICQIVSLFFLFILVKEINDLNKYAVITVISATGTGLIDWFYARKYCNIRVTLKCNVKKHILPILMIFAQNISVLIYVNSDMTLLGMLTSDYYTGLYGIAANIYKGMKTLVSALIAVAIPRLSYYYGTGNKEQYYKTLNTVYGMVITFVVPLIVGTISLSKEIIILLAGDSFLEANYSTILLSISTFFCMMSYIYGQCILIPLHEEKTLMIATALSAIANMLLNVILIPFFQQDAAAFTTIIAEAMVFFIAKTKVKKQVMIEGQYNYLLKSLVGSIVIVGIVYVVRKLTDNLYLTVTLCIFASVPFYFIVECLLKNAVLIQNLKPLVNKFKGNYSNEK